MIPNLSSLGKQGKAIPALTMPFPSSPFPVPRAQGRREQGLSRDRARLQTRPPAGPGEFIPSFWHPHGWLGAMGWKPQPSHIPQQAREIPPQPSHIPQEAWENPAHPHGAAKQGLGHLSLGSGEEGAFPGSRKTVGSVTGPTGKGNFKRAFLKTSL